MLVLSRKPGEKIVIDNSIVITVVEVEGNRVRIGVEAPDNVRILRGELTGGKATTRSAVKHHIKYVDIDLAELAGVSG